MDNKKDDIRWIQRFDNYKKALHQLSNAVKLANERELSDLEKQGLIQAFEFTHELAWKTLKDFLNHKGNKEIYGSKDAVKEAFKYDILENGEIWMDMIKSRNRTSHTYNEEVADKIIKSITTGYLSNFEKLLKRLSELTKNE